MTDKRAANMRPSAPKVPLSERDYARYARAAVSVTAFGTIPTGHPWSPDRDSSTQQPPRHPARDRPLVVQPATTTTTTTTTTDTTAPAAPPPPPPPPPPGARLGGLASRPRYFSGAKPCRARAVMENTSALLMAPAPAPRSCPLCGCAPRLSHQLFPGAWPLILPPPLPLSPSSGLARPVEKRE